MANAIILKIADAVTTELNESDNNWSLPFTAERVYVPLHDLRQLTTLTVSVVPKSLKPVLLNRRGDNLYDYLIDIGIQQVIGTGPMTDAEIVAASDPIMGLAQEITDEFFLELLPIPYMDPLPRCIDAENEPIYHAPDIDEKRLFTTIVTLNFRLGR